jgi:hypothetical protein
LVAFAFSLRLAALGSPLIFAKRLWSGLREAWRVGEATHQRLGWARAGLALAQAGQVLLRHVAAAALESADTLAGALDWYPDKRAPAAEGFRAPRGVIEGALQGLAGLVVEPVQAANRGGGPRTWARALAGALAGVGLRPLSGLVWTARRVLGPLMRALHALETRPGRKRTPRSFLKQSRWVALLAAVVSGVPTH